MTLSCMIINDNIMVRLSVNEIIGFFADFNFFFWGGGAKIKERNIFCITFIFMMSPGFMNKKQTSIKIVFKLISCH